MNLSCCQQALALIQARFRLRPEAEVRSPKMYLGVCGNTGLTAYVGLVDVVDIKPGEVIFISSATGAVGSIACQIAKLKGARVIGSAGGEKKCAICGNLGLMR
jgi:NADPH-dependent curcumin reductase CurA